MAQTGALKDLRYSFAELLGIDRSAYGRGEDQFSFVVPPLASDQFQGPPT